MPRIQYAALQGETKNVSGYPLAPSTTSWPSIIAEDHESQPTVIASGPKALVAISHALIKPVYRMSEPVGGKHIKGGTKTMFVLGPDGDNRFLFLEKMHLVLLVLHFR